MKLKTVEHLRDHILDSLVQLEKGKIDVAHMGIIAKSGEAIMSSLKIELTYAQMIGNTPHIPFIHDCHQGKPIKIIEQKKLSKDAK